MVRPPGHLRDDLPRLDEEPRRAAGPVRRAPRDRHLQYLLRAYALQQPLPHPRRAREGRRARVGRLPARIPGDVARRDAAAAHVDALPQPREHGRRGVAAREPARRRGAAHGLRQDHARAPHGRCERRPAHGRRLRRAHALGQVPRHRHRLGDQHLVDVRGPARGKDHAHGIPRGRVVHEPLARPLHDHGNGLHHGVDGRGAGGRAARQRRVPGGGRAPQRPRAHGGPPRGGDGEGGSLALEDPRTRGVRERDPGERGDRRLDQRRDPPHRDRQANRRAPRALRLRPPRPRRALPREPHAERQVPDGGFLLRRRPSRGDPRARRERAAPQVRAHGERQGDLGEQQGRALLEPRRDLLLRETLQARDRHRGAARQSLPGRSDHQAVGGDARAHEAPRPRGRFRNHRGFPQAHRRPQARHRRALRHGAQELRPQGLPRDGRSGQHALASEAAEAWNNRHGAHLRRAHEWHGLRDGRSSRRARGGGGRGACAGAERRPDRARRHQAQARPSGSRHRAGEAAQELEGAQAAARSRLLEALPRPRPAGARGRGSRFPYRKERRVRAARQPLAREMIVKPMKLVLAVLLAALPFSAAAQEKLKFAHVYETSEPFHTWALWAAGEIAKRTNNRYTIDVFPASSLGNETQINQSLSLGTVDIIYTGQAFAARTYPPLSIGGAPYMFRDFKHWQKYAQSPVFWDLAEGYHEKSGNKIVAAVYYGVRQTTANKAIVKPDDMKGLKLRVPDAPLYIMYPKVLGANATPIAFAEVYLALQNGTVDAQENPLPTILAKKFYEVQSHINLTGHITEMLLVIVSGQLWSKLSMGEREVM